MWFAGLGYIFGWLLLFLAAGHIIPILVSLAIRENAVIQAFVISGSLIFFLGGSLILAFRQVAATDDRRLNFLTPIVGWVALPVFASFPFLLSGSIGDLPSAYFEAVSGLTTTGASVFADVDELALGIVFWRAFLQWLGGVGVFITALAILAPLNIGGMHLLKSALPHGEGRGFMPRARGVIWPLLGIYSLLTLICTLLLWAAGLPIFDGLMLAMSTVSTGGFMPYGTTGDPVGGFAVQFVLLIFMPAGALNITYIWALAHGKGVFLRRDAESTLFLRIAVLAAILIAAGIFLASRAADFGGVFSTFWNSLFLSVSALSTTGFTPVAGARLPLASAIILFALVIVGAAAGSTAGGIKLLRVGAMARHSRREIHRLAHPHSIVPLYHQDRQISEHDMSAIWFVFFGFVAMAALGTIILSALKLPFYSAAAAAFTAIGNAGPMVVVMDPAFPGYAGLRDAGLWVLSFLMIIGRLEISMLIAVLTRLFWRR